MCVCASVCVCACVCVFVCVRVCVFVCKRGYVRLILESCVMIPNLLMHAISSILLPNKIVPR